MRQTLSLLTLSILILTSCQKMETVENLAGKPLKSATEIKIGKQYWTIKNLDVDRYRNGDLIPRIDNDSIWSTLTSGAYCYYANDSASYAAKYGKLYNWYAVNDPRGLAPNGYHIPSIQEWGQLANYLGVNAGDKMKTTTDWYDAPRTLATNSSGFSALPGGTRGSVFNSGSYYAWLTAIGFWWASDEYTTLTAPNVQLFNNSSGIAVGGTDYYKQVGMSVRLVKN